MKIYVSWFKKEGIYYAQFDGRELSFEVDTLAEMQKELTQILEEKYGEQLHIQISAIVPPGT